MNSPKNYIIKEINLLKNILSTIGEWNFFYLRDFKLLILTFITLIYDIFLNWKYQLNYNTYKEELESYNKLSNEINFNKDNLEETKTALVTGANSGLGYKTVQQLLIMGFKVLIVCRNIETCEQCLLNLKKDLKREDLLVELIPMELSDLNSIKNGIHLIKEKVDKLDILINNAGIMKLNSTQITNDGYEQHFQINYLSHYLITTNLLPLLLKSFNSQLIFIGSLVHWGVSSYHPTMFDPSSIFNASKGYSHSKFALVTFANYLHKKYKNTSLNVMVVDPGTIGSNLFRTLPNGFKRFLRPVEAGLLNLIHALLVTYQSKDFNLIDNNVLYCPYWMLGHSLKPNSLTLKKEVQNNLIALSSIAIGQELSEIDL